MSNIHTLNDLNNNNINQNNNLNNNDNINNENNENNNNSSFLSQFFPKQIYNMKQKSFLILCILISIYFFLLIIYYIYFKPKSLSWNCELYKFGANEINSIFHNFHFHRLITSILLHYNILHLLSNCISLFFVGFYIEYLINNTIYYILFFIFCGIYGNIFSLIFNSSTMNVGASGSIIGICGYIIVYFIFNYNRIDNNEKRFFYIFFIIIIMNLLQGILNSGSNDIDIFSHLGGLLTGIAISFILIYKFGGNTYRFDEATLKNIYYIAIALLVIIPVGGIIYLSTGKYYDISDYVC